MNRLNRWWIAVLLSLLTACGGGGAIVPTPLALTQNFISEDSSISFQYPADWIARVVAGQITIANSAAAADAEVPAPGQFQTRMIIGPIAAVSGLSAGTAPLEVVKFFADSLGGSGITFSTPGEITIGQRRAARVEGIGTDGQGIIMAVDMGNGIFNIISASSSPGEMSRFEGTLDSILETMVYVQPQGS